MIFLVMVVEVFKTFFGIVNQVLIIKQVGNTFDNQDNTNNDCKEYRIFTGKYSKSNRNDTH